MTCISTSKWHTSCAAGQFLFLSCNIDFLVRVELLLHCSLLLIVRESAVFNHVNETIGTNRVIEYFAYF